MLVGRLVEIQDGFIVGIFNYCDRWCETCAFTSRCRLFVDQAEYESAQDPNLKAIVEAPPLPQDTPPPPPAWMEELLEAMNKAALEGSTRDDPEPAPPKIPPTHEALCERAHAYAEWVFAWLRTHDECAEVSNPDDPRAVVHWFYLMIASKIVRAVRGLAEDDPTERDWPADHDGSAKVALLAVERSHQAWLQISVRGMATWNEVEPFARQLLWLRDEIERIFPNARAFVRPGFDEPEELARLLASEGV